MGLEVELEMLWVEKLSKAVGSAGLEFMRTVGSWKYEFTSYWTVGDGAKGMDGTGQRRGAASQFLRVLFPKWLHPESLSSFQPYSHSTWYPRYRGCSPHYVLLGAMQADVG